MAWNSKAPLECRKLTVEWKRPLLEFLQVLDANDTDFFHPHPFTEEAIGAVIMKAKKDDYYVMVEEGSVLGYGMLRGWDEGYDIPSLGIAIHRSARNTGLGKAFMHFLHVAARRKGATKVRLRVKRDNIGAAKLYESLGYEFRSQDSQYLVGVLDLGDKPGRESP